MGAGSTQVTIAQYSSQVIKEGGKNKTQGNFEILSKAWDSSLGGFNFDIKLAELLAEKFNTIWKTKRSYKENDQLNNYILPMTKLKILANKIKEILSANSEFPVKIEQLYNNIDLNTKITRIEFEEICIDLFNKITIPIDIALKKANLQISDLYAVELLGGGVRMPKIKKILDGYFSNTKVDVGQHLNGDEAMAMGAAFKAANLSTAFRVRKVGATDISSFGVSVRLNLLPITTSTTSGGIFSNMFGSTTPPPSTTTTDTTTTEEEKWSKFTSLYPAFSPLPSKSKTVAFTHDQDISCSIEYDNEQTHLPIGTDPLLAVYNITGVAAFAKEHANKNLGVPKVHLSFALDASGIVSLVKAEATLELPTLTIEEGGSITPDTTTTDTTSTTTDNTTPASEETTTDSTTTDNTTTEKTTDTTGTSKPKTSKKATKTKNKDRFIRKTLTVNNNLDATKPPKWSLEQITEAKQRRYALKAADDLKKATEAALNDLEGYIYRVKNQITDMEDELKMISTDIQRSEVIDLANEIEEWLYDEGRGQTIEIYKNKQNNLEILAENIFQRYKEVTNRKNALNKAYKQLNTVLTKVENWTENSNMGHITTEEKEKLITTVNKVQTWLKQKETEQNEASPYEKPVFSSTEVAPQLKTVSAIFEKLLSKPKPAPVVVEKVSSSTV